MTEMAENPPADHDSLVEAYVEGWRITVGPAMPFNEGYWRRLVERTLRQPANPAPGVHQGPAVDRSVPRSGPRDPDGHRWPATQRDPRS